jgi:cystathionine beta-lyase
MRHDRFVDNPLTALPIEALRARHSVKWRQYDPDVLPLFVAEMDTPLAPAIAETLIAAIERGDTGYAHPGRLREAFAGFAQRHYGWSADPAQMVVVPDAIRGISEALKLVSSPGAGVVVNTPVYAPFFIMIPAAGRRLVESPLRREPTGEYRYDLEALDRDLAADGVEVLLLCNPHNPTGVVLAPAELDAIADMAQRHRVRLLVDEIHAPLTYPGQRHTTFATVPAEAAADSIIFASASKAFNLPCLKASLVIAGGEPAWARLAEMPIEVTFGTGLLGVMAGEVAFEACDDWLAALVRGLDHNRRLLADLLAERLPGVGYIPPQATYLAWLDLSALDLGDDPSEPLLERGRVALASGPTFGTQGNGHARLNLATSPTILTEAVRRMAASLDSDPAG